MCVCEFVCVTNAFGVAFGGFGETTVLFLVFVVLSLAMLVSSYGPIVCRLRSHTHTRNE